MLYIVLERNCIQFFFQLFISEIAFLIGRQKRKNFFLRLAFGIVLYVIVANIWEIIITGMSGEILLPYVALYFGYAVLTAFLICFCYDVMMMELLFIVTGGYAAEHMCFALSHILLYLLHIEYVLSGSFLHLIITRYIVYAAAAVFIYYLIIRKNRDMNQFDNRDIRIALLSFVLLLTAIGLSVYWSYPENHTRTLLHGVICPAYSFVCSVFVLQMEYYVLRENSVKHEKEIMEQMIRLSDIQQKSEKEAIDIINIKCHDLKHQISALAKIDDPLARSEYLKEVKEAVSIYDAVYHTGNKALDYILREKTLLFNEYHVKFSCMVEGEVTLFMEPADVYALMGNALDNALERVLQEAEEERVISLHIKRRGEMTLIHLENRCSREPKFREGFPVTNKKDKQNHGFGVRSIRYITEKYHGELYMRTKNGRFFLDILFPKKQEIR